MRAFWNIPLLILALAVSILPQGHAQRSITDSDSGQDSSDQARKPIVVHSVPPEYPEAARLRRLIGHCNVKLRVDIKGLPNDIQVEQCFNPLFIGPTYAAVIQYRFKPGTDSSGKSVASGVSFDIHYIVFDGPKPTARVGYSLRTSPGTTSPQADADGVFPLTRQLTAPKMTEFAQIGIADTAFGLPLGSSCDVQLVITAEGRSKSPWVSRCDDSVLEKPVIASLLKSRFKPALLNGQPVSVKLSIRLVYEGLADPHQD